VRRLELVREERAVRRTGTVISSSSLKVAETIGWPSSELLLDKLMRDA
jgi:hypothetical protein